MSNVKDMQEYLTIEQEKSVLNFISALAKLDAIKILGCARTMGIKVALDAPAGTKATPENLNKYIRSTEEIMSDMIDKFILLNRSDRRIMIKMLKGAR